MKQKKSKNSCDDNNCDVGSTLQDEKNDNPEIAERKAYLEKRLKILRGKRD